MKIKAWVHADRSFIAQTYEYKIYPFGTTMAGSVVVCEIEVDVNIPADFDPAKAEKSTRIESLTARIQEAKNHVAHLEKELESL